MDIVLGVVGGAAVLALVALSAWGAVALPPGSKIPLHHGFGGWNNWQPKKLALIVWPAIGAVLYVILLVVTIRASSTGRSSPAVIIAPIAMIVIAVGYLNALRAALRESNRD